MKIYRIEVGHFAPKDEHESIEGFLLLENEEEVFNWIDKNLTRWTEYKDEEELNNEYEWLDDDSTLTFVESIKKSKGDLDNDQADFDDLHYGLTLYRWVEHECDTDAEGFRLAMSEFILNEKKS